MSETQKGSISAMDIIRSDITLSSLSCKFLSVLLLSLLCCYFNLIKNILSTHPIFGIVNMLIVQLHMDNDWLGEDLITPLTVN